MAVTQGWNGYRNKSQHRKLTPEKKILPLLLQGSTLDLFVHESGALSTELSPLPAVVKLQHKINDTSTRAGAFRPVQTKTRYLCLRESSVVSQFFHFVTINLIIFISVTFTPSPLHAENRL